MSCYDSHVINEIRVENMKLESRIENLKKALEQYTIGSKSLNMRL